jgi:hypothetical protein
VVVGLDDSWVWAVDGGLGTRVFSSDGGYINTLVTASGLVVASTTDVQLVDTTGAVTASYESPRLISVATADEHSVVLTDGAGLITLTLPSLSASPPFWLTEACTAGVLVSGHRFVCAAGPNYGLTYYIYDTHAPALLGQSSVYGGGAPLLRVRGADAIVTSGFTYLVRVHCDSTLTSDYLGSSLATTTAAFVGWPVTDLVTTYGHFLSYSPTCSNTYAPTPCFAKDGELGTLASNQSFLAMAEEDDGVYIDGLVMTTWPTTYAAGCNGTNCQLVRVNAVTREIVSSVAYTGVTVADFWATQQLSMRFDAANHRALLIHQGLCQYGSSCQAGFWIEALPLTH